MKIRLKLGGSGWASDGGRYFKVVNEDGKIVGEIVGTTWRWKPNPISGHNLNGLIVESESPAGVLDALNQLHNEQDNHN